MGACYLEYPFNRWPVRSWRTLFGDRTRIDGLGGPSYEREDKDAPQTRNTSLTS